MTWMNENIHRHLEININVISQIKGITKVIRIHPFVTVSAKPH